MVAIYKRKLTAHKYYRIDVTGIFSSDGIDALRMYDTLLENKLYILIDESENPNTINILEILKILVIKASERDLVKIFTCCNIFFLWIKSHTKYLALRLI